MDAALRGKLRGTAVGLDEQRTTNHSACTAGETIRLEFATIAEQRDLGIGEQFDLADDAVAAVVLPCSARAGTVAVGAHTKGVGVLERLDGSVQRVSHMTVDAGDAIETRTCAHAASGGLVIGEGDVGAGIVAADGEVAHGAVAGGGDAL